MGRNLVESHRYVIEVFSHCVPSSRTEHFSITNTSTRLLNLVNFTITLSLQRLHFWLLFRKSAAWNHLYWLRLSWLSSVPPDKRWNCSWNEATTTLTTVTTSFYMLSNLLRMNDSGILSFWHTRYTQHKENKRLTVKIIMTRGILFRILKQIGLRKYYYRKTDNGPPEVMHLISFDKI